MRQGFYIVSGCTDPARVWLIWLSTVSISLETFVLLCKYKNFENKWKKELIPSKLHKYIRYCWINQRKHSLNMLFEELTSFVPLALRLCSLYLILAFYWKIFKTHVNTCYKNTMTSKSALAIFPLNHLGLTISTDTVQYLVQFYLVGCVFSFK